MHASTDERHKTFVTDGELIDAGQSVEATRVDGNRIVVRRVPHINAPE